MGTNGAGGGSGGSRPRDAHDDLPRLARRLGLFSLVVYGVGDMLGSGIYALMGRVAAVMGNAVWLAFLASMAGALLTGLSYASLGSRYPRAGGAATFAQRAFRSPFLSAVLGLAVLASGLTSIGTQSHAFAGHISARLPAVPSEVVVLLFIAALSLVNFRGMRESSAVNIVCTAVETAGLAIVIIVGVHAWGSVDLLETPARAGAAAGEGAGGTAGAEGEPPWMLLSLVLQGGVLAFYSFIGFEDMINVVEEVRTPRRTFPIAVIAALGIVTVVYLAVAISAVSVVPHAELAASPEPLVEVVRRAAPSFPTAIFWGIALFAITNTALLNSIMGSRLAYGMARQGLLPRRLGNVHPRRRTPHVAILVIGAIIAAVALAGDLSGLAAATSVLLLASFIVVNAALVVVKRRPGEARGAFEVPLAVPIAGILVCAALLSRAPARAFLTAGILVAGIVLLLLIRPPRGPDEETAAEPDAEE